MKLNAVKTRLRRSYSGFDEILNHRFDFMRLDFPGSDISPIQSAVKTRRGDRIALIDSSKMRDLEKNPGMLNVVSIRFS